MRIGLDAHILGKGKGGVERVVHYMVERIPGLLPEHEFIVFINRNYVPPFPARVNVRFVPIAISDPLIQRSVILPWLARRWNLDLLHVQRIAPFFSPCPVLVSIHDILPLTARADHPGLRDALVRWLTPGTVRKSARVLTVSETVRQELIEYFALTPEKVVTVFNGIDHETFRPRDSGSESGPVQERWGLKEDYILYMGAIAPRKNLEIVLQGFHQFQSRHGSGVKLVLAGLIRSEEYRDHLRRKIEEWGLNESVVMTGFISDSDYLALLQGAKVFLAPSRGEGFDLPALEAAACAVPVICSDIPVHRELLKETTLYFHPDRFHELADALVRLWNDDRERTSLVEQALNRSKEFHWSKMAQGVAEIYSSFFSVDGCRSVQRSKSTSACLNVDNTGESYAKRF